MVGSAILGEGQVVLCRMDVLTTPAQACREKSCSIGRPYLYSQSAGGEAGMLIILRSGLILATDPAHSGAGRLTWAQ